MTTPFSFISARRDGRAPRPHHGLGTAAHQPRPPCYTPQQAACGTRGLHRRSCAGCHLPDMSGRNEASPLAGAEFHEHVAQAAARASCSSTSRRPCRRAARTCGAEAYLAVTAFILQANGATAGAQPLTATTAAPIGCDRNRVPAPAATSAPAALGAPDGRTAPVAPGAPAAPAHPLLPVG